MVLGTSSKYLNYFMQLLLFPTSFSKHGLKIEWFKNITASKEQKALAKSLVFQYFCLLMNPWSKQTLLYPQFLLRHLPFVSDPVHGLNEVMPTSPRPGMYSG